MVFMTILITGSNGQLGQDFQAYFRKNALDFIATARSNSDNILDITNIDQLHSFVKDKNIDIIINCAAYNLVDKAETDSYQSFLVNGIGVRNLAQVSNELGSYFVHFSTDYIFDGQKHSPYTLLDEPKPISKYGESKLLGEKYIQQVANKFLLIRTSWVFGLGNTNFVKKVLRWSQGKSELKLVTDEVSNPTYTIDLVNATMDLLDKNAQGVYQVTNSGYCSRYEWAEFILKNKGWNGKLIPATAQDFNLPAKRPLFSSLDNFGLKESIGYDLPTWQDATTRFLKTLDNNSP